MTPQKLKPHGYQKRAAAFGVEHACAGFFFDPGLGKTIIMLMIYLVVRRFVGKMLVVCPLRPAYSTWPDEVQKWSDFCHLKVVVLHGDDKDKKLAWARQHADIMVINPEGLQWLCRHKMADLGLGMLVVDESTRFKHTNTMRFKYLKDLLNQFKRRYILTGSPAPNGLLDLFGQIYILDGGNALGKFVSHYRMQHFMNPVSGSQFDKYKWLLKPGAEQEIYKKLRPLVLRASAADYLELPELIYNRVNVILPPDAQKQYDRMEELLIAELGSGDIVTAANAAAATNKCRQIANGGIYHEDGEKFSNIHDAKTDAVEDLIEELQGKPALVAYEYRHDLDRLRGRLGADVPFIGGGVAPSRFRQIEAAWNAGELPILLAQPQSVAHGLNLQGTGAAVINMAQTWDLEVREQFIRRVWRQGQKERVVVHDIVAKHTIDEVIVKMIQQKDKTQRALLAALKTHFRRAA